MVEGDRVCRNIPLACALDLVPVMRATAVADAVIAQLMTELGRQRPEDVSREGRNGMAWYGSGKQEGGSTPREPGMS
jgi:hypothetical protein